MKPSRSFLAVLTLLSVPALGLAPRLAAADVDVEALYQKAVKSSVYIATPLPKAILDKLPGKLKFPCATGSGSLIDVERKLVLTNHHVVEGSDTVYVQFPMRLKDGSLMTDKEVYKDNVMTGKAIRGKVIHKDQNRDLAIVQLDKVPTGTPALTLAKSSVSVGATTWNIGSPGAVEQVFSITEGKVRSVGFEKFLSGSEDSVSEKQATMITTTNPSNPGDSGGPLLDKRGYQVGVTQGLHRTAQLVSKFVDITEVRAYLGERKIPIKEPEESAAKDPPAAGPKDPPTTTPPARVEDLDPVDLYKKVVRSCVFIITPLKGGYAMGSGSLIDVEKKIVLTNHHVVDGSDFVYVQFPIYQKDGEIMTEKEKYKDRIPAGLAIKGKVLYSDQSRDLAFVQLEKVPADTPALVLAKKSVSVGATTWNIGSPGAVSQVFSVTEGKVRSVGVEKFKVGDGEGNVFEIRAKMVTTTNPSNQGDSGGPLFDKRGVQVGVTQSGDMSAQLVSKFVDASEVWALLAEKKMTIKEGSITPILTTPPKTTPPVTTPPKKGDPVPPVVKKDPPKDVPAKATPADEKAAGDLMRRARLFAQGEDNLPTYLAKLQEIIKKYPGTTAAKDAKKVLDAQK